MRPQELYSIIGNRTASAKTAAEAIAVLRARCELWNSAELRVDEGSGWSAEETRAALLDDLGAAEDALRAAAGRLEAAWAALGRLASD